MLQALACWKHRPLSDKSLVGPKRNFRCKFRIRALRHKHKSKIVEIKVVWTTSLVAASIHIFLIENEHAMSMPADS